MKVVILAGGYGTRISEESHLKPKPMIEIGEQPILWHIMKYYSTFGFNEFIIFLLLKNSFIVYVSLLWVGLFLDLIFLKAFVTRIV